MSCDNCEIERSRVRELEKDLVRDFNRYTSERDNYRTKFLALRDEVQRIIAPEPEGGVLLGEELCKTLKKLCGE
jgi:hypothetical protein